MSAKPEIISEPGAVFIREAGVAGSASKDSGGTATDLPSGQHIDEDSLQGEVASVVRMDNEAGNGSKSTTVPRSGATNTLASHVAAEDEALKEASRRNRTATDLPAIQRFVRESTDDYPWKRILQGVSLPGCDSQAYVDPPGTSLNVGCGSISSLDLAAHDNGSSSSLADGSNGSSNGHLTGPYQGMTE